MNKVTLYFADQSTLDLHEGDFITPIARNNLPEHNSSMTKSVELWNHTSYGLIPSIMDALTARDYFYLNHDHSVIYNSNAIVKIVVT